MWWKRRVLDGPEAPVSEMDGEAAAKRVRGKIGRARRGRKVRMRGKRRMKLRTIGCCAISRGGRSGHRQLDSQSNEVVLCRTPCSRSFRVMPRECARAATIVPAIDHAQTLHESPSSPSPHPVHVSRIPLLPSPSLSTKIAFSTAMLPMASDEDQPTGPFEGPEKLLEIWFQRSPADVPGASSTPDGKFGLRSVPRDVWADMLDIVKCKILSVVEGTEIDAYLLR